MGKKSMVIAMNAFTSTTDPTTVIARSYLLKADALRRLRRWTHVAEHRWTDTFFDTKSHELSSAECILMKDSDSANYWKFFCYATDNIMEITTDEMDIRAPLARLLPYDVPQDISKDLLTPFFEIRNVDRAYEADGDFAVHVIETDFGFACCTISTAKRINMADTPETVEAIDRLANEIGLQGLADYDAVDYL